MLQALRGVRLSVSQSPITRLGSPRPIRPAEGVYHFCAPLRQRFTGGEVSTFGAGAAFAAAGGLCLCLS